LNDIEACRSILLRNEKVDDQEHLGSESSPRLNTKGEARRRFTKSGTALSGVILTMASRNGMATTVGAMTPSGFISATANSHSPGTSKLGRSPGYWKTHPQAWPTAHTDPQLKFGRVFTCSTSSPLYNCTLLNVVSNLEPSKSADRQNVAMHVVASLLNVRAHLITCLDEYKVFEIWSGYLSGGFVPTAGATPWSGSDIVRYLKTTMA
jgi:hypothetical protein